MMHSSYTFEDVDSIAQRLEQVADDLGYLVLAEVTGRNQSEKLARVNITETELRPYLHTGPSDDRDEDGEDAVLDDERFDPSEALEAALDTPSAAQLARAGFRWLLQNAAANMNSVRRRKFKLSAWTPKGDRLIYSARFSCENTAYAPDEGEDGAGPRQPPTLVAVSSGFGARGGAAPVGATPGLLPLPAPTGGLAAPDQGGHPTLMLEAIPEGRVWKSLGGGYEHLLHLYERGFGNLANLQNSALAALSAQNQQNQIVIGELADRVVTLRLGTAVAEREEREEAESAKVRESLGGQVINQLGSIGRYVVSAKFGLPPELSVVAEILQDSPELLEVLKKPEVQDVLRDDATRKELAQLLLFVAAGKGAEKAAQPSAPEAGRVAPQPPQAA